MLAPTLIFAAILFVVPFVWLIVLSFTNVSFAAAARPIEWVGWTQYERALTDSAFRASVGRSAAFALLCVIPEVVIALVLSEVLYHRVRLRRTVVPVFMLPALLPTVGVALYWRILLQGEFGIVSYYLTKFHLPFGWALLSNGRTILFTLAWIDVWQWAPFATVILFAVRLTLPPRLTEAALLDGASRAQAYRDVTLPLLTPGIVAVALLRLIDTFKEFDKTYVLTGGGPGSASELASVYLWRQAFKYWDFAYAAALTLLVYLILYACTTASAAYTHAWKR